MRILVVEDERKAAAYLRKGLTENGFVVDVRTRGDDCLDSARAKAYDLILLDVMLPGKDGWSILAELREAGLKDAGPLFDGQGCRARSS